MLINYAYEKAVKVYHFYNTFHKTHQNNFHSFLKIECPFRLKWKNHLRK